MCGAQRSQIQFEDEDHAYMSFRWVTTTCLRWEPQPVTLLLYPVVIAPILYKWLTASLKCLPPLWVSQLWPFDLESDWAIPGRLKSTLACIVKYILCHAMWRPVTPHNAPAAQTASNTLMRWNATHKRLQSVYALKINP